MRHFRCVWPGILVIAGLTWIGLRVVHGEENRPTAEILIQRAVEQDQRARERRQQYLYDLHLKTEDFDQAGKLLRTRHNQATLRAKAAIEYQAELDGQQNQKISDQQKREIQENQKVQGKLNLEKISRHFRYEIDGRELVDGHRCWRLSFSPKDEAAAGTMEEKVIYQLHGHVDIDEETFAIVRSEGRLEHAVSVMLVASVDQLELHYQGQELPNGDLGPSSLLFSITVRAPFYFVRQNQQATMSNYRPAKS